MIIVYGIISFLSILAWPIFSIFVILLAVISGTIYLKSRKKFMKLFGGFLSISLIIMLLSSIMVNSINIELNPILKSPDFLFRKIQEYQLKSDLSTLSINVGTYGGITVTQIELEPYGFNKNTGYPYSKQGLNEVYELIQLNGISMITEMQLFDSEENANIAFDKYKEYANSQYKEIMQEGTESNKGFTTYKMIRLDRSDVGLFINEYPSITIMQKKNLIMTFENVPTIGGISSSKFEDDIIALFNNLKY